ncbi:MAG: type II secretion system F family protein [Candidatus Rokubacteria bacterium]|nr:type II secretion system F family protein [Candidatus Rokubacteria bacterium]
MVLLAAVALTFVTGLGVTLLAAYLFLRAWPAVSADRLRPALSPIDDAEALRFEDRPRPRALEVAERIGRRFGTHDAGKLSAYRRKLLVAGFPDPRAVAVLVGAKIGLAVTAPALYLFWGFVVLQRALPNLAPTCVALAAAGLFAPDVWLRSRRVARQREIVNALPDVLDLLMVCVEAGMGFDAAVARVAEQPPRRGSPLHDALMLMHLETRAGRGREEALRALAERTGVAEVRSIVSAFIQTDRLGTPLGRTLRVHAEAARVARRHRAEERAQLAPVKMIFPTVFFLMPSFFLVAMGPSLLLLMKLFSSMGGLQPR